LRDTGADERVRISDGNPDCRAHHLSSPGVHAQDAIGQLLGPTGRIISVAISRCLRRGRTRRLGC